LLRETLPPAPESRCSATPTTVERAEFERVRASDAGFGIAARKFEAASPDALDAAFARIAEYRPDATADRSIRCSSTGRRNRA